MPNNDDMEHGYPPITPPEGDIEEQEMLEPELAPEPAPVPGSKPGWEWIGSPGRPEAQKSSDGISDLFEVDADPDTDDLVNVDIDADIIDADEDGSLDSLTEVTEEDIMGDEETGQMPLDYKPDIPRRRQIQRVRRPIRFVPPTSAGRTGG